MLAEARRKGAGSAKRTHSAARSPNMARPATASTESCSPISNAAEGDHASMTSTAAPNDESGSPLRRERDTSDATTTMPRARNADIWKPVTAANAPPARIVTVARGARGSGRREKHHTTTAHTIPR